MAIPSTGNPRRAYTEDQWNEIRPQFTKLYRDDKNTLKYTMDQLRLMYGFKATEKMYKTHIKKWGLEKYNKDEELLHLIRLDRDSPPAKNRSYTINGRPTTVEDAKRHFRRKKVKSLDELIARLPGQLPDSIDIVYEADEKDDDDEQIYSGFGMPAHDHDHIHDHEVPMPHLVLNTGYAQPYDVDAMDVSMDDRVTLSPDDFDVDMTFQFPVLEGMEAMTDGNDEDPYNTNDRALAIFKPRKPSLITTPGLEWATESFLYNIGAFNDMIVESILAEPIVFQEVRRFNKLWDLLCTASTHSRQNRPLQARQKHNEARETFSNMLHDKDPWLLLSLCLVLNDSLSNENRVNAQAFLNDMSQWTNRFSADHPIVRLVRDLQNTADSRSERSSYLIEATVRMISDRLNKTVGPTHDLSLELARLHSRTLTTVGLHSSAETLLSQDLAMVENRFGPRSLQNCLRLSALARARYIAHDYRTALGLYQDLIAKTERRKDEASVADIKYGAMYFISKSHAQLGNYDAAIEQAQRTLRFAMEKQGSEHYWTSNARELIDELTMGGRIMEIS